MSKDRETTPAHLARAEKQRLAAHEGARAMTEVAKRDAAVRMNMARLKELRLARDAEQPPAPAAKKKPARKTAKKKQNA